VQKPEAGTALDVMGNREGLNVKGEGWRVNCGFLGFDYFKCNSKLQNFKQGSDI